MLTETTFPKVQSVKASTVPKAKTVHLQEGPVAVLRPIPPSGEKILTPAALAFVGELHRRFNPRRLELLNQRQVVAKRIGQGVLPGFLPETLSVRQGTWQVAPAPADLNDRRVEITGPVERKMMINALNSGAKVFMADLEDATAPTWENVIVGQANLGEAVRRTLGFTSPEGKEYRLADKTATLVVRPRGWHLHDANIVVDGEPIAASLMDFGLYFFHNAQELLKRGTGPYFYLPKMESHLEARLWNDVFVFAQEALGVPRGTIRATVLIETILAAYEMEEILFELREHAAGLNAGRWDYLFSAIKKFAFRPDMITPDRVQLTMTVPFMRAYTELLVATCHRRGAHAIGGMAAFIPSRKDPQVNATALAKVREDKEREARDGFDGTWVAHPDLVPAAREVFDQYLRTEPHQKARVPEAKISEKMLLPHAIERGVITEAGFRNNINVALQYIDAWLQGLGAVAIHNLMEDAATAEISRSQLWQWVHHQAKMDNGTVISANYFLTVLQDEVAKLGGPRGRLQDAADLLQKLVLSPAFPEFLTLPAYEILEYQN